MPKDFNSIYFEYRRADEIRRRKQHELDRKFIKEILGSKCTSSIILLDIGCANGEFSKPFLQEGWEVFGIEINQNEAKIAKKSGIRILKSIEDGPNFDVVIIRGTLHHIPNYLTLFESISKNFITGKGMNKFLFILAEPNRESLTYRKFQKLPAIEENEAFSSNYKIHGAQELKRLLNRMGYQTILDYPYLKTPYRNLLKDTKRIIKMMITNHYLPTPWFRNMFNIGAVLAKNYDPSSRIVS